MKPRIVGLLALGVSFAAGPVFAQDTDALTYPLTSFFDWTGGPLQDFQDQGLGQYQFEEGMVGVVSRAGERYPEHLSSIQDEASARREIQGAVDAVLHNRPRPPFDHYGDVGNPDYMPDWNHDGVYGGVGDFDFDTDGDPHGDSSDHLETAYFLYPCARDGGVDYETVDGACAPYSASGNFKVGIARELKVVNARGLVLDATLWLPGHLHAASPLAACDPAAPGCTPPGDALGQIVTSGRKIPGVVFSNGLSSRQEHYYWFAMRMAREGFIVVTYDPAGQGESEGTWVDLFDFFNQGPGALDASGDGNTADCQFRGACRDAEDMVRWFVGATMADVRGELNDEPLRIAARKDPGTNAPNPALGILDTTRVALAGNSMGALSTLHYLFDFGNPNGNAGMDGNPLPNVVAAVSLSGAAPTYAAVPIQFQTSDYDGSPALVGPTVFGLSLGQGSSGIGYHLIKQRYDLLRDDASRTKPIELVILEGGVHTDHAATPDITKTTWAVGLASDYAAHWLNCHVKGTSCAVAEEPVDHLSRALASEIARGKTAGQAGVSECITVPDRAILNQPPLDLVNALQGKHVCDCAGTVDGRSCDTPLSEVPY